MTSIFISYKREDELRAGMLVKALEAEGLPIWWDRNLPGGEEWRANIEKALNDARVVIVLWTRASVGADGGFVRDEASRARARLVPVRMEQVQAPLGFGELQAIDLSHWRGSRADPFFKDLVAVVRARIDGKPTPRANGPAKRLYRRLATGTTVSAVLAMLFGFGMNVLGVQDQACALPIGQPAISDFCGAAGLGHRPLRAERLEWEGRSPGSCDALREVAAREGGFYRSAAADLLSAAKTERAPGYSPAPRDWRSYVRSSEIPFKTENEARADALSRAHKDAIAQGCAPRDAFERLTGAVLKDVQIDCRSDPRGGYGCGADYVAQCHIEARAFVQKCP